jgi:RimJ/RimL family protein N-acetyltransferase
MIETSRLVLRAWRDNDREPFWAMACDPRVMAYLPPLTREESDAAVDRMIATERKHGHVFWALERKIEGDFIGFCGILPPARPFSSTRSAGVWRIMRGGKALRARQPRLRFSGRGRTYP